MNKHNNTQINKLPEKTVFRNHVFKILDELLSHNILWIDGIAGSGKTTLFKSYLFKRKINHYWFTFSEIDIDFSRLLLSLAKSLQDIAPNSVRSIDLIGQQYPVDVNLLLLKLFQEIESNQQEPLYVVLDDFHHLSCDEALSNLVNVFHDFDGSFLKPIILSRHKPSPHFSKLVLTQKLAKFDETNLQWTLAEARQLCRLLHPKQTQYFPENSFSQTKGWVSGIILLLQHADFLLPIKHNAENIAPDFLFHYFANEVFNNLIQAEQIILMKSAFLPDIILGRDFHLASRQRIAHIFDDFHKKNFFIYRQNTQTTEYLLHPLFKSFLLNKAEQFFDEKQLHQIKQQTAEVLTEHDSLEHAIPMLVESKMWSTLSGCIQKITERNSTQSCSEVAQGWLRNIADDEIYQDPWMIYWKAMSFISCDQKQTARKCSNAFQLFREQNNTEGMFYSICGIIESTILGFVHFEQLQHWVETVRELLSEGHQPKQAALSMRLSTAMHLAILHVNPFDKELYFWRRKVDQLAKLLSMARRQDQQVMINLNAFCQYLWQGELEKCQSLATNTQSLCFDESSNPISRGFWYVMKTTTSWMMGDTEVTKLEASKGLADIEKSGITYWKSIILAQKAFAHLIDGELDNARDIKSMLEQSTLPQSQLVESFYYDICAQLEFFSGNIETAWAFQRLSIKTAKSLSLSYAQLLHYCGIIPLMIEKHNFRSCERICNYLLKIATPMNAHGIISYTLNMKSYIAIKTNNLSQATANLQKALAIAKSKKTVSLTWWLPSQMVDLYDFALRNNIQTHFVIDCIKKRRLQSHFNLIEYEQWSWRVKIYTLGRFEILVDNRPITMLGKSQRKPLILLRTIIALGIWRVHQSIIAENIWPDADADEGIRSLHINIHRLRKILGHSKTIIVKDGYVGLNPDSVWIDVSLVDFYLKKLNSLQSGTEDQNIISHCLPRLLERYKDNYLENILESSAEQHFAIKLKKRYTETLKKLSSIAERHENYELAIDLLNKLQLINMTDESIYRRKIAILLKLDRFSEAQYEFQQCREILAKTLGTTPCTELIALFKTSVCNRSTLFAFEKSATLET
ncbi:MAG: hypothetical protein OEY38_12720 [Gammaproteobacteria bacterium]|nr:hypothetical protein [Gammaproteobacteria bacterium]